MKAIDRLKADPRVHSVSDERGSGDGYWVILNTGFSADDCHALHEDSPSACLKAMRYVCPCDCEDCVKK